MSVCVKNAHFQFSMSLLINVHFSLLNTPVFIHKKLGQGSDRKSWIQESNGTDDVFDKLLALSEQENAHVLQNTAR
jgi:hypothetical protein